jgi:hypothetical protein
VAAAAAEAVAAAVGMTAVFTPALVMMLPLAARTAAQRREPGQRCAAHLQCMAAQHTRSRELKVLRETLQEAMRGRPLAACLLLLSCDLLQVGRFGYACLMLLPF